MKKEMIQVLGFVAGVALIVLIEITDLIKDKEGEKKDERNEYSS